VRAVAVTTSGIGDDNNVKRLPVDGKAYLIIVIRDDEVDNNCQFNAIRDEVNAIRDEEHSKKLSINAIEDHNIKKNFPVNLIRDADIVKKDGKFAIIDDDIVIADEKILIIDGDVVVTGENLRSSKAKVEQSTPVARGWMLIRHRPTP